MVENSRCPRCGGQLVGWSEDITCLQCGYLEHSLSDTLKRRLLGEVPEPVASGGPENEAPPAE